MPEFVQCDICSLTAAKDAHSFCRCMNSDCGQVMCTSHARVAGAQARESLLGKIWGAVADLKCPRCGELVMLISY